MNTMQTLQGPNPLIKDSLLGSKFFDPDYLFDKGGIIFSYVFSKDALHIFYMILSFFSVFFIIIIIYVTIRMFEIRRKEHAHMHHEIEEYAHNQALREKAQQEKGFKNEKWRKVLDYLFSSNENDWRLGIIEADLMLFDLLTQLGYKGETLGDKLKDAGDNFRNINLAWEAHNIRNKIAHEGSSFEISIHEAKRIVALYEQVFQGYGYI